MKPWHKILLTLLLIAVLVFIIFFIVQSVRMSDEASDMSPLATLEEMSDDDTPNATWKTFKNTTLGIAFNYPGSWSIFELASPHAYDSATFISGMSTAAHVLITPEDLRVVGGETLPSRFIQLDGDMHQGDITLDDVWKSIPQGDKDSNQLYRNVERRTITGFETVLFEEFGFDSAVNREVWTPQAYIMTPDMLIHVRTHGASRDFLRAVLGTLREV